MTDNDKRNAPGGAEPDRIDLVSDASLAEWARKLAVTEDQLKDAVTKVGDRATDVEMHLKGSRSTTNRERVKEVGGA
ncbi:DUF3606 domain-containing protein [Variovorax sp. N23]|uniref:DUF3606 domain-containing protein n=1 Tax=Variovorax sp. N23 TaxID=2980555 RepID=UPI0021C92948|nr:DUF3606 domain-containing protein [Variovorax sp. N23]MCU4120229.1 DUF3606 domain-containing protein [Variovorax sp. N23]